MMFRQDFERDVAGFEVCVCALGIRYTVPKCCVFCHAQNTPPVWRGSSSSSVTREVDTDSGGEDRTSNVRERCSGSPERRAASRWLSNNDLSRMSVLLERLDDQLSA